jgi:hypothetical protein
LRLAYSSTRSGLEQIWVSLADGSQPRQLTHFSSGLASSPRWSPDGQSIVFDATINNNRDVYVVRADGASQVRLTSEMSAEVARRVKRQWIYFMSDWSGSQQIWRRRGGQPRRSRKVAAIRLWNHPMAKLFTTRKERHAPGVMFREWRTERIVSELAWQNWSVANDGLYILTCRARFNRVRYPSSSSAEKIDLNNKITTVANILTDLPDGAPARRGATGKHLAWGPTRASFRTDVDTQSASRIEMMPGAA